MSTARPPREKPTRQPPTLPLPTKDGVGPSCVALPPGPWVSIDGFLAERFAAIPADTWRARMQQGELVDEHGAAITPGSPEKSRLFALVRDGEMPKSEKKLSPAQVETIRLWIAGGAKVARTEPAQPGAADEFTPE